MIDYVGLQTDLEMICLFTLFPFEATLVMVTGRFLRVFTANFIRGLRDLWLSLIQLFWGVLSEVFPSSATWYDYAFRIVLFLFFSQVANLFIDAFHFIIRLRTHFAIIKYIIRKCLNKIRFI
jgi:hypothetical protein